MSSLSPVLDASTAGRRASQRVRKSTNHYAPSDFSTGKRKRGDEIANQEQDELLGDGRSEEGDESEEDEDESDDEEDEPDEEELREQKRRARKTKNSAPQKPSQKKPKMTDLSLPFRAAKAPAKKRAPKKVKATDLADAQAAGGLFAQIFAGDQTIEETITGWSEAFDQHESRALADFINFVLKSAGCNLKISEHDVEDVDGVTSRLQDLQDEYMASEPTDYPLIARTKAASNFKSTVSSVIQLFVKSIAASGLLHSNPELMENVQIWFSTMASAGSRSIRHTSTLVSLNVVSALCEIGKELKEKAVNTSRHASTERKKSRVNKERVKELEQKAKEANKNQEAVEVMLKDWFDTMFVHRYRDVDAAIRRDCVEALGSWIMILPDVFLDGNHLRYLGWLLSDASPVTRGEVVKQLHRMYEDDTKLVGLKTFTERFRSRLVEIGTADSEVNVRIAGIELLNILRDNELLEPDDIDAVGKMIYHDDIRIRKAVASFFVANVNELYTSKLEGLGGPDSLEELLSEGSASNYDAPRLEWLRYKCIAEMLESYDTDHSLPENVDRSDLDGSLYLNVTGMESRFTLPVMVLYTQVEELEEWLALAGYLLFDHSAGRTNGSTDDSLSQLKQESILSEKEEIILLEVLNATVRHYLEELSSKLSSTKVKLTKQQRDNIREEQEECARHLVDLIPRLFKKFGDLPSTAAAVLRLESVLALPSLQKLGQNSDTNASLLDDLSKQFMSHSTDDVLAPATAAIFHAKSYGDIEDTTAEKLRSLWEDVVNNLAELLNPSTVSVRGASQIDELLAVSNNLQRVYRLSMISDCIAPLENDSISATVTAAGKTFSGAIDFIIELISRALPSNAGPAPDPHEAALEDQIAARAAEAALHYFQWNVKTIMSSVTTGVDAELPYTMLEALAERRDQYVANLGQVLKERKASEEISVAAAGCLLDLYTVSNVLGTVQPRSGVGDDYIVLIMDFEPAYEKAAMNVFLALEKGVAKLSGKKLDTIVSEDSDDEDANAEPVDDDEDDPLSEDELNADYDEDDPQHPQTSRRNQEAKALKPLVAQLSLCKYTSKIVLAICAGVIRGGATRKRLERNKAKLGPNFKEVLAYLDIPGAQQKLLKKAKGKAGPKALPNGAATTARKARPVPKSNAIVAEDEMDDDIEDPVDDDDEPGDEDEEDARQQLLEEEGPDDGDAPEDHDMDHAPPVDIESVTGD